MNIPEARKYRLFSAVSKHLCFLGSCLGTQHSCAPSDDLETLAQTLFGLAAVFIFSLGVLFLWSSLAVTPPPSRLLIFEFLFYCNPHPRLPSCLYGEALNGFKPSCAPVNLPRQRYSCNLAEALLTESLVNMATYVNSFLYAFFESKSIYWQMKLFTFMVYTILSIQ